VITRVLYRCVDAHGVIAAEVIDRPPLDRAWAHLKWKLTPDGTIVGTGGATLRGADRVAELKAWAESEARCDHGIARFWWTVVDVSVITETKGYSIQGSDR
jgi:hypothetical protein